MANRGEPTRIDKSYLSNYAGGVQSQILAGLKFLALIDEDGKLSPEFTALVNQPSERKAVLRRILTERYPAVVELGKSNTTQQEMEEAFEAMGVKGETKRKAVAFFLKEAADLPVSPNWKTSRISSGNRSSSRRRGAATTSKEKLDTEGATGDTHTVDLVAGGKVTLAVSVNLFELSTADRDFVLKLVDALRDYGSRSGTADSDLGGDDA
jgi:hypothetical protein